MHDAIGSDSTKPVVDEAHGRASFDYVDHAKAVGIVLIVVGHSPGVPALAHQLIFSFHVPLFYLLSGFLISKRKLALPVGLFIYDVLRKLLVPYVLFFALAYGYWLATCSIGDRAAKFAGVAWYEPLRGLADGLGSDLFICPPLWFFPSLIVTTLAFQVLCKRMKLVVVGLFCLAAGLLNTASADVLPWRLPWGLDTLGVTLAFYAAGHCLRDWCDSEWPSLDALWRGALAVLFAGLWIAGAFSNDAVDINQRDFDGHPLLTIPTAFCGIAALLLGSSFLATNELSRWLSRNTLLIFPLHPLVFNVISGVRELVFGSRDSTEHGPWLPILYSGVALLVIAAMIRTMDLLRARRHAVRVSG